MRESQKQEVALLEQAWPDAHAALVRALLDPRCYPDPVVRVEHLETHISDVLLTGRYAYKLKKPLALGFLDFSTLADRRFYCQEELRLNRRLAPELYLDAVAITGTRSRPQVGGEGDPIEYAVRMLQFDQSGMLESVLARGELKSQHLDEIARQVAARRCRTRRLGFRLEPRASGMLAVIPGDNVPPDLVAELIQHKVELLKLMGMPFAEAK
jgi:aminoglycoside phosphotransferase family enzyme